MNPSIYIVTKLEHHVLKSCPCSECIRERKRLSKIKKSLPKSHLSIPVSVARLFGFIPSRQPKGSLARQLMDGDVPYSNR